MKQNGSKVTDALLGFSPKRRYGAEEVEGSEFRLARVYASVAAVVGCLTEQEAREGQKNKLYTDA